MKTTLYIATHNQTGLKYFGKSDKYHTDEALQSKYHGSGKFWKRHLNKYGDDVSMKVYGTYLVSEVEVVATQFSIDNNIVDSNDWANLVLENGLDGGATNTGVPMSEAQKEKLRVANKGQIVSQANRDAVSKSSKGKATYRHKDGGVGIRISHQDPRVISGEYISANTGIVSYGSNINIFNDKGELMYECINGQFPSICRTNSLPIKALQRSYRADGKPIYTGSGSLLKMNPQNKAFVGWYAIKI